MIKQDIFSRTSIRLRFVLTKFKFNMGYDVNNIFPRTSNGNAKINGKIDHFDTLDSNVVSSNPT